MAATPTLQGQSGYINMPSAIVEADGTFSSGYSYDRPYGAFWVSSTVLPRLQITGRYVSINGTLQMENSKDDPYWRNYGRYKDKVVDAKLKLLSESRWLPTVSIGASDFLGTGLFDGQYIVATKMLSASLEGTIGYGRGRLNGVFAGARWRPQSAPAWALVAEYDANNYVNDLDAAATGAGNRQKGPAIGVEYRWGWLGAQVARQRDHFSANLHLSIPFSEREFIPKLYEPRPFQRNDAFPRVSVADWQQNGRHSAALVNTLTKQNFRNVRAVLDDGVLKLTLTNNRIAETGRAVGRASRIALAFAPEGTRAIHITYTKLEQPIATYEFFDLRRLSDYLTALVDRDSFLQTVLVRYSNPADKLDDNQHGLLASIRDEGAALGMYVGHEGNFVQVSSEDREANRFKLVPKMSFFFNDPSGALRYETALAANYDKRLAEGLYFNSAFKLNLFENISGVTQPSNSVLPHVRTDIAEYKRGGRFKLNRALLNKYMILDEHWYARASGGFYEEMFRGAGGQVLYLPKDRRWAADLTVDALQQRDYKGWLGKRDYSTVTALGALHYQLPYDITVTGRAGRFLAKDNGVRLEFKRRFRSGVEIGAWYTKTNGWDITSPGSPADPYNDKGIFLSVPLNIMLTSDSQAVAGFALSPWTRDVGQMVISPGDLYELFENPRRDLNAYDGLGNFSERKDEQHLDVITQPVRPLPNAWPAFRWRLEQAASTTPNLPQWAEGSLLAGGAILASATLDKPVDRFVRSRQDHRMVNAWGKVGKTMPVVLAGAAAAAVSFGDNRMQNMGIISLQSIAGAVGVSMASKRVIGRARPLEELGALSSAKRSDASFPSNHAAIAFAAVTPFAQEYDAPWLYGLAAAGSLGRVANRQHWVSDVFAGGVVGYAIGSWLWQAQRDDSTSRFVVVPGSKEIGITWSGTY
nr:YjbH domain-containing protein [Massilia varians]